MLPSISQNAKCLPPCLSSSPWGSMSLLPSLSHTVRCIRPRPFAVIFSTADMHPPLNMPSSWSKHMRSLLCCRLKNCCRALFGAFSPPTCNLLSSPSSFWSSRRSVQWTRGYLSSGIRLSTGPPWLACTLGQFRSKAHGRTSRPRSKSCQHPSRSCGSGGHFR